MQRQIKLQVTPEVVVAGSLNLDYIAGVERLPRAGETVVADSLLVRFGGKGANQAMAAARQGAGVAMLGCVGADSFGRAYLERLQTEHINTAGICCTKKALTGTALIAVDQHAENTIIVAPGANSQLSPSQVRLHKQLVTNARVVLLQFEIPMASVVQALRIANRNQVPVVLNPSPYREDFRWGSCLIDTLIVNSGEALAIFKQAVEALPNRLASWRRAIARRNIQHLVITRGPKPTLWLSANNYVEVPTIKVKPVDTVGAGDAFAGAFAARRAKGADLVEAIRHANCAGALATLKPGAQESIPTLLATQRSLREAAASA